MAEFSVCVPSYNGSAKLNRLLSSIGNACESSQLTDDQLMSMELLVVLDGSSDDSIGVINLFDEAYPIKICCEWQENKGLASARNKLVSLSDASRLWFLDDDMVITAEALEAHFFYKHNVDRILSGACLITNPQRHHEFYADRWQRLSRQGFISDPGDVTFANTSGFRSLFRKHSFNEKFKGYGFEDYELGVRLLSEGVVLRYLDKASVSHLNVASSFETLKKFREEGFNRVLFANLHEEFSDSALTLQSRFWLPPIVWSIDRGCTKTLWCCARAGELAGRVAPRRVSNLCFELANLCAIASGLAAANGSSF